MGSQFSEHLERFQELGELETELKKSRNKSSSEEVIKHGWDPKDTSPNIAVDDDYQLAKHSSQKDSTDAVRGRIGYKGGHFVFEFEWKPGTNKHVTIGLATRKASLSCKDKKALIGANEHSIGWDLVDRCIWFNGCKTKPYPESADDPIPSTVIMGLDMSEGILSFRSEAGDYGVAMKGLKHLADSFYVATSMDAPGDTVRITYLGSLERVRRNLLKSLERSSSSSDDLAFDERCGKNIRLSNGNRTATRKNAEETYMHATVLTSRPLKEDEMFTIRMDEKNRCRKGAWLFGATTTSAADMDFPTEMTRCEQGKRWIYNEDKIIYQNKRMHELNIDLDESKVGDKLGIKKTDGKLQFYVNGARVGTVSLNTDQDVYGVVDVFGRTVQVSIINETGDSPKQTRKSISQGKTKSRDDAHALLMSVLPKTHDELIARLQTTMDRLKDKNPEKISRTRHHLKINMLIPFGALKSDRLKQEAAEKLGEIDDSAQTIADYMQFLWDRGLDTDEETDKCYGTLLDIVIHFGDKSLLLCKRFGECGLVKRIILELERMKDTHREGNRESELVREYFIILHNCAKAAENRSIYRECKFLEIGKQYADASVNNDFIATNSSLTMSYICDDDQLELLALSDKTAEHIVQILHKAADNERRDGTHNYSGWHSYEIAVGITNMSRNRTNIDKFMKQDAISALVKMLDFKDSNEKECGLNGIWSLVTPKNRKDIIKSGGLSLKLRGLASSDKEGVRQAAIRLLTRLVNLDSDHPAKQPKKQCEYKARCMLFRSHLQLSDEYFDTSRDACYCPECHGLRGDEAYYSDGNPPKRYGVPVGWCKFGLSVPPRAKVLNVFENWHRAYHGTKQDHIEGILQVGEIVPAGQPVLGGAKIKEGSGHFKSGWKPDGFNTKKVFLSPSIRYAGVNTYAKPKMYTDATSGCKYIAKVAIQVLIDPHSYDVSEQTVGATEELDPGFSNQELEWSTNQHGSCILYGILVKLDEN